MVMAKGEPAGCKVKNRFSLFESDEEDNEGPPGLTDSEDEEEFKASRSWIPVRVKRWSQNASQRKSDKGRDSIKLLPFLHVLAAPIYHTPLYQLKD